MKAFWTGCSLPAPMPSTVVTDLPAAARAGIKQLTTGTPSTSTVHAPQTPAPHTSFVPVRLSASRTTSMRRLSGSSGRGSTRPLIVIVLIRDLHVFGGRLFWRCLAALRGGNGAGHQGSHHDFKIREEGNGRLKGKMSNHKRRSRTPATAIRRGSSDTPPEKIGRAAGRGREEISGGAGSFK